MSHELLTKIQHNSYHLSGDDISDIERGLDVLIGSDAPDLGAVILRSPSQNGYLGALGRTLEVQKHFPEMEDEMLGLEDTSLFVYVYDRSIDGNLHVVHSTRLLVPSDDDPNKVATQIIEELDGQVTVEQIADYHGVHDPTRCIFISTDLAVGGFESTRSKPYGLLAYKAMIEFGIAGDYERLFALMNQSTLRSLAKIGISPQPLCGKNDYTIQPTGDITFEKYQPYVCTLGDMSDGRVFKDTEYAKTIGYWAELMNKTELPIVYIDDFEL